MDRYIFKLVAGLADLLDNFTVVPSLRILDRHISLVLQNFELFEKKHIAIKTAI